MKKSILTVSLMAVIMTMVAASCVNKPKAAEQTVAETVETAEAQAEEAQNDSLAPDFELPNLQGSTTALSALRGKYVVLDFWGSWCVWCIKGFPNMKTYYAKYKDQMEILGVDCRDTEEDWKAAVEKYQLPWMQVRCPDEQLQAIAAKYGIEGFPTKVVIDPQGKLLKTVVGEDPAFYTYLDTLFKK